jgi:ABC-type bacteriocin/lantibiotic exporter with double-glycine peptidase domain
MCGSVDIDLRARISVVRFRVSFFFVLIQVGVLLPCLVLSLMWCSAIVESSRDGLVCVSFFLLIKTMVVRIATPLVRAWILLAVQAKLHHGMPARIARWAILFRKATGKVVALNINGPYICTWAVSQKPEE